MLPASLELSDSRLDSATVTENSSFDSRSEFEGSVFLNMFIQAVRLVIHTSYML